MSRLGEIVAKFRKSSPNIAAAFDEVELRLLVLERPPAPTPTPSPVFGGNLAAPPARPTGLPETVVSTWTELRDLVARGNARIKVRGRITVPLDWRWVAPNVWVYAETPQVDGLVGGAIKLNGGPYWLDNLDISGCPYDGVKLGDGAAFTNVVISGCHIHDAGSMGILIGNNGGAGYWFTSNHVRRIGFAGPYGDHRDGHAIYTGGPCRNGWVLNNTLEPLSYGVHAYPQPDGLVVSGNTIRGGQAAGIVWPSAARNVRAVGNLIDNQDWGAIQASGTGGRADDNVALRCDMWTAGYTVPAGTGNTLVATDAAAQAFRVKEPNWPWLPPRTEAVCGAT